MQHELGHQSYEPSALGLVSSGLRLLPNIVLALVQHEQENLSLTHIALR